MTCTRAKPECMSRVTFGDCSCLRVREETARDMETRFWSIVDADGLSGLPSDMWTALEQMARAARNRDMWKAQCERQAKDLTDMREALHDAIERPKGVVPASADRFYTPRAQIGDPA